MTRWVVHSQRSFTATHALRVYRGRPETPHEHRWSVAVRVGADGLTEDGFAVDFHEVHAALERAVAPLDGTDLNRHPEIGRPTPSAERVAEVLADHLGPEVAALGARLLTVSVWEGPDNRVDLELG